ncbi:conserved hypothetical protein [Gluconacetobacter diazotrophicus PA1 5]|uniref:Uncharacterized protein n=2 Tax=Gluconacetobacter diazotrophicus TaxID=33996 RepID=A9HKC9_GLUDA|nr:hypothetical protein [Gluconacetobacter diazotrophicus]ACI50098.1 conserved hypothetical protein [Gluconacetobacter diazotrophicus PA1 5]MBB2156208.1 hypothetical protein [Gluconacetobacter diazotrophicus]TWB07822.1 hypothetical protein FBZ86_10912 [Gluconacetobacter diazotrophicus]CAP56024.1 hypothetical protein GDI2081 [Gluconacetobacter diazotrophicus PA1 5]
MRVSSTSSIIVHLVQNSSASSQTLLNNSPSTPTTFSDMSPQEMEAAREQLTREGKITLHQSGEMALMDGYALEGVNGGKLVSGSSNMYSMIDNLISYQEKNGIGDVQGDIASLKSLRSILEEYDKNNQITASMASETALNE